MREYKIGDVLTNHGTEYTCIGKRNGKFVFMPTETVERIGLPFVRLELKGTWAELDRESEEEA